MLLIAAGVVGPSVQLVQWHYGDSLPPRQSWYTVSRKMGFGPADSYRSVQAVAAVAGADSIVVDYSCPGSCKACVVEVWHTRAASVVRHFALQHIVGSVGIPADQVVAHKAVESLEEAAPLVAPGKDCNHSVAACTDPQVANTPEGDSDAAMEMLEGEVHSFGVQCPEYMESKGEGVGHRSSLGSQLLVAAASREDTSAGYMPESPGNLELALLRD